VNANWFCEKHGKSNCDAHFSALNKFLEQGSKLKKLTCIDDLIECIESQQFYSNQNKQDFNLNDRLLTNLRCFKLNPNFINPLNKKKKLPDVNVLKIQRIKSYYNIQLDENFELKTSLLADSPRLFHLPIASIISVVNAKYRNRVSQQVTTKYLKIKKNCGKKESFFNKLKQLNRNVSTTSNTISINNGQISECKPKCRNCKVNCKYRIEEISQLKQKDLRDELKKHGHPSSLIMPNGFQRTTEQEKSELKAHYEINHQIVNQDEIPNTSRNFT
jgi:hypothetical protein